METFNHADRSLVSSISHVVDWQLVRSAPAAQCGTPDNDVRERIRALQAKAMTLSHGVRTTPRITTAHRALNTLEAEIIGLRAELAWRTAALPHAVEASPP